MLIWQQVQILQISSPLCGFHGRNSKSTTSTGEGHSYRGHLRTSMSLRQFLGLAWFYRKFIPFFTDVRACLNTMLRKGAAIKWMEECSNAFRLLKFELVECLGCNIQILTNHLCCSEMHLNIVILVSFTKKRHHSIWLQRSTSFQ